MRRQRGRLQGLIAKITTNTTQAEDEDDAEDACRADDERKADDEREAEEGKRAIATQQAENDNPEHK